jgi:hypothetical protein
MLHLPTGTQDGPTRRHVTARLEQAAARHRCGRDVFVALRLVLSLEGGECRPK